MSARVFSGKQDLLPGGKASTGVGTSYVTNDDVGSVELKTSLGATGVVQIEASNDNGTTWTAIATLTFPNPDTNAPQANAVRATIQCPSDMKRANVLSLTGTLTSCVLAW